MTELSNKIICISILLFISTISGKQHDSSVKNSDEDKHSTEHNNNNVNNVQKSQESASKTVFDKPIEDQIRFGDKILKGIWEFTQHIDGELRKFESIVDQSEHDTKLVAHNLLEKQIEPSRKLIEYSKDCDPNLPKKLEYFMNYHKAYINNCRRIENPKNQFHQIILNTVQYLDDLQISVTKEVSLCELMRSDEAQICYNNADIHAEEEKLNFMTEFFYIIEREILDVTDEIENFLFGCTLKAMSEVKKANRILEKKLKCCKTKNLRHPCNNLKDIFNFALSIKPYYTSDPDIDYLEIKYGG